MRHMSFALTTAQMRNRTKFVTRRLGWKNAKPGDVVQPVVKGQGIPKGGKVEPIGGPIRFISVRRESLRDMDYPLNQRYGAFEARLEGFPHLTGKEFVEMFCEHNGCRLDVEVTRIEFEYVEPVS